MRFGRDEFIQQLGDLSLLPPEELAPLRNGDPSQTAEALAKDLVKRKKLTLFQAQQIAAGKGKALVLGNYVLLDKLGQGGMGLVLLAEHRRMKRTVALKVLSPAVTKSPQMIARFQREVEAAARLDHPNIVTAHDAGEADGRHFYVMQYVPGTDLSSLVKKGGPLPAGKAIDYVLQAARGLDYAHQQGIIHRDIKPANLLLDKQGVVKILDMGLARFDDAAQGQAELTQTGAVLGTIDFMAPEQALNSKTADARSDIYSLGITLWYLLTGKPAYEGPTLTARLMAHQTQPIPSLSGSVSAEVSDEVVSVLQPVFHKMAAKQSADRYQTMADVIRALESCLRGTALTTAESSPSLTLSKGASGRSNVKSASLGSAMFHSPNSDLSPSASQDQETIDEFGSRTQTMAPRAGSTVRVSRPASHRRRWLVASAAVLALAAFAAGLAFYKGQKASSSPVMKGAAAKPIVHPSAPRIPAGDQQTGFALQLAQAGDRIELPPFEINPLDGFTTEMWLTDLGGDQAIDVWTARPRKEGKLIVFRRKPPDPASGIVRYGFDEGGFVPYASNRRFHAAAVWFRFRGQLVFRLFVNGRAELRREMEAPKDAKTGSQYAQPFDFSIGPVGVGSTGSTGGLLLHQVRFSRMPRYLINFDPARDLKSDAMTQALYRFDRNTGELAIDQSANHRNGRILGAEWVPAPDQREAID